MLRKSRAKKLVDASYNRFAFNDPADLPDWFVDDEAKHHRPQLPIPKALLEQIRAKYADLASKPIAKVAEARARKKRHAALKLKAAKKKAEALANEEDMSERQKLKAIEKAMKAGAKKVERPGKTYVVAKAADKGRKRRGAGMVTLVDKRLKCDKRSMKRAEKKKTSGGKY